MPDDPLEGGNTIPVFNTGEKYVFKYYFEDKDLYSRLSQYYNSDKYRFEIPEDEFPSVESTLTDNGKAVQEIDAIDDYVVVKEKYTAHPDILFKESILKQSRSGYNLFLMKDRTSVKSALTNGAEPVAATELSLDRE